MEVLKDVSNLLTPHFLEVPPGMPECVAFMMIKCLDKGKTSRPNFQVHSPRAWLSRGETGHLTVQSARKLGT